VTSILVPVDHSGHISHGQDLPTWNRQAEHPHNHVLVTIICNNTHIAKDKLFVAMPEQVMRQG
jgi:hypothetical protein